MRGQEVEAGKEERRVRVEGGMKSKIKGGRKQVEEESRMRGV